MSDSYYLVSEDLLRKLALAAGNYGDTDSEDAAAEIMWAGPAPQHFDMSDEECVDAFDKEASDVGNPYAWTGWQDCWQYLRGDK